MNISKCKECRLIPPSLAIAVSIIVIPVLLCAFYRLLPSGSIGPIVFIKFLVDIVLMPFLVVWWLIRLKDTSYWFREQLERWPKPLVIGLAIAASFFAGLLLSVLGINVFILLTAKSGLMDYELM